MVREPGLHGDHLDREVRRQALHREMDPPLANGFSDSQSVMMAEASGQVCGMDIHLSRQRCQRERIVKMIVNPGVH